MVDPRSHLNFRKPGHCQSYPLTDLMGDMASIMARASCVECGLLFKTLFDLQNHVRNWCFGQSDRKRPRLESQSSEEKENEISPL